MEVDGREQNYCYTCCECGHKGTYMARHSLLEAIMLECELCSVCFQKRAVKVLKMEEDDE